MKKKSLFGIAMIWLAAVLAILAASYYGRELDLNYIEQIHFQNGYLYYVDRGEDNCFRIIRSDAEGTKGDIIACSRYEGDKYRKIRQIFFDSLGEAYVLVEENEVKSFKGAGGAVFRCDFANGTLKETGFDFAGPLCENREIYIQGIRGNELFYFALPETEEIQSKAELWAMDQAKNFRQLDEVPLEYPFLKSQFFLSQNNIILWMDYEGEVFAKELGSDSYLEIEGITGEKKSFKSLSDDDNNRAYVMDYKADCIREINLEDRTAVIAYEAEDIRKQEPGFAFQDLLNPDCTKSGFCAGKGGKEAEDVVSICSYHDGVHRDVEKITLTVRGIFYRMFPVYAVIVLVAVMFSLYWYISCVYQVQTILVRLILVFILGLFAADHVLEHWIEDTMREQLERNQSLQLSILGEQLKEHIVARLEQDPNQFPSGEKNLILNHTKEKESENADNTREVSIYVYSIIKADEEQNLMVCESMSEYSYVPVEWCYSKESISALYQTFESGESVDLHVEDENGKQNNRFIPLVLNDGTVYGVLSMSVTGNLLDYQIWYYQWNLKVLSIILLSVLTLVLIVILLIFLRPLKTLKISAGKLAAGELGVTVPVHGHDEIAGISAAFNQMSLGILRYVQDIQDMSNGYYKFIPAKILELLGKESIQQVRLGDEITENMTILSVYANRGQEKMELWSTEEVYAGINQMLPALVEPITSHHGVVEHFEHTGLSAFFTENSKNALDAAVRIQKSFDHSVQGNVRTVAISYGKVMIGVIGHENRMEAAAISAHSNLAKALRLKGSTYGARILITHLVYRQIPEFEKQYHARYLGNIYLTANDTLERVYDVYDGDPEEEFYYKELTKPLFEQGVEMYVAKKFYEARLVFVEVLKQHRKDRAAKEYLYRCDKYYKLADSKEIDTFIERF